MKRSLAAYNSFLNASRGVALVIVLAIVALVTGLVIGLLVRAGSERRGAAAYSAVYKTRELTDTVVNLVQAQINDATSQGADKAWASQPGAVRTYELNGSLQNIYKLYSATDLTTPIAANLANDTPPATWVESPASWVDLNAPVTIKDPSGGSNTVFPILDPRNPNTLAPLTTLDGFSITKAPGAIDDPKEVNYQPAPMPVRWLYALQDGSLIAPDATSTGAVATFAKSSTLPTKANPIVGRVAFWTDDDTCKVNVNTASDGVFWDTPRYETQDDIKRAKNQPANGEFQAYPGHPATTSLRPILTALGYPKAGYPTSQGIASDFFKLLPRFNDDNGSKVGTAQAAATPSPKSERIYSSIGEMLLNQKRDANDGVNRQLLESGKFFLTAHSRAPEINLFGKPRISLWPQPSNAAKRTPTDTLINFCSTVNGYSFSFTRESAADTAVDAFLTRNAALLNYLDFLTSQSIPGFESASGPKTFDEKYTQTEKRQILTEIFDYIRIINLIDPVSSATKYAELTNNGGSAEAKGQVAPSILNKASLKWNTQGFGQFPVISEVSMLFIGAGCGKDTVTVTNAAVPVDSKQLPGYTPNPKIATEPLTPPSDTTAVQVFLILEMFRPSYGYCGQNLSMTVRIKGMDGLNLATTPSVQSLSMPASADLVLDNASFGGFYNANSHSAIIDPRVFLASRTLSSTAGTKYYPFFSNIVQVHGLATQSKNMTFTGGNLTIEVYAGASANDASRLVQTYTINVPTQTLPIPKVVPHESGVDPSKPLPSTFKGPWLFGSITPNAGNPRYASLDDRFASLWISAYGNFLFNRDYDVMFSMVPSGDWTDYRLFARGTVPVDAFEKCPASSSSSTFAINLRDNLGQAFPGVYATVGKGGNLLAQSKLKTGSAGEGTSSRRWWPSVSPLLTSGAQNSLNGPGDWDNVMGNELYTAGPFINKADEGAGFTNSSLPYYGHNQTTDQYGVGTTLFSPNRQLSSAVAFGSLPTGLNRHKPWQTLLFRPGPSKHPGNETPKDHLLLDLFWMPVAEPYAISERFSTAGKINLNYQMLPFSSYLERSTGLRAVLASETVAKIGASISSSEDARLSLNLDKQTGTLRQFEEKFNNWDIFKSATEICDIYLVPKGESTWTSDATAQAAWYGDGFLRVGDNVRERPYSSIYSRVTTKSNSFTVHYIVQSLKNPIKTPGEWDQSKGTVLGEYRGSTTLERYINPNDDTLPDYAVSYTSADSDVNADTLEKHYRWRIVENHQFAP